MRQLEDRYHDTRTRYAYIEDEQPAYEIVYVRRPPRRRKRMDPFFPLHMSMVVIVLLLFVVDDPFWLLQRAMAAITLFGLLGIGWSMWRAFTGGDYE
jgi:hypothetical protein